MMNLIQVMPLKANQLKKMMIFKKTSKTISKILE